MSKMLVAVSISFELEMETIPSVGKVLDMIGVYSKTFVGKNTRVTKIEPLEMGEFSKEQRWEQDHD